ncbi:hypothetical protein HYH03_002700 [Edaphochlamys debaryana]|uniref:Uncharacterized protein n=1 Tax=Edaphochlamys debaryana TaxID=47281 RepID=A0A835YDZ1_9CHLO|nr:hypothetical protein HYH03_002700 [Edaphochlamys debaryana]|eukprot:KAG2499116.1 hypothetical protein HYH03_002700 [Edaphochlamys debaryana]
MFHEPEDKSISRREEEIRSTFVQGAERDEGEELQLHGSGAMHQRTPMPNSAAAGGDTAESLLSKSKGLLVGKYELFGDVEVVWQLPPKDKPTEGVLLYAHGCNHGAIDLWPKSESCPQCIGLPEEMNITLHSLLRGYAVVAVSSRARVPPNCWQSFWIHGPGFDPPSQHEDFIDWHRVKRVLDTLLPREGLSRLPLFALGGSSGGGFVLGLPGVMPGRVAGVAVQGQGGPPSIAREYRTISGETYPPTVFVHMPRDTTTAQVVAKDIDAFRKEGVVVREVRVHPQPLTPLYLAQRCAPEIDEPTSRAIHEAFRAADYIDEVGYLRHNPRDAPSWRQMLIDARLPGWDRLHVPVAQANALAEELNLLFAGHELTSETTTDMLDFLEGARRQEARGAQAA